MHRWLRPVTLLVLFAYAVNANAWPLYRGCGDHALLGPSPIGHVQALPADLDAGDSPWSAPHAGHVCNHGCHLLSHLMGPISESVSLPAEPARGLIRPVQRTLPAHRPDNLFRPPRTPLPV